jgi:nicotinamide-nucleotide amidase
LLPGPPNELKAMWQEACHKRLEAKLPKSFIRSRFYRVAGLGESDLDQLIAPVYTQYLNPVTTILAGPSDIQIHLRARCATEQEALALLNEVGSKIEPLLGDNLYTTVGDPLEACVGQLLKDRGQTVAVAESCTGGMLAARLSDVSGSSSYFLGGYVTYTEALKIAVLGVPAFLLEEQGPVSEAVAIAMAEGARQAAGTDYAVSVTGIAGPTGGTDINPVGTVWIGVATPKQSTAKRFFFFGDRARVRVLATQTALNLLRLQLLAA